MSALADIGRLVQDGQIQNAADKWQAISGKTNKEALEDVRALHNAIQESIAATKRLKRRLKKDEGRKRKISTTSRTAMEGVGTVSSD